MNISYRLQAFARRDEEYVRGVDIRNNSVVRSVFQDTDLSIKKIPEEIARALWKTTNVKDAFPVECIWYISEIYDEDSNVY